jgi:hypothetical protein
LRLLALSYTSGYGDSTESWAPFATNGGPEHVTLKFKRKVYIADIRILENWNPGRQIHFVFIVIWHCLFFYFVEFVFFFVDLSLPLSIARILPHVLRRCVPHRSEARRRL